ncbi:MAG TPA: DNA ligase [Gemmataceae bacterium]|nr:DNA ligase [Gemmataceae bacterium]
MPDLDDGESIEMQGSGSKPYVLKNVGGVYSCTCPAWRNQSLGIEKRTCKHLRKLRGDAAEDERIGSNGSAIERPTKDKPEGSPLLLAERWDGAMNLAGWWMSEKLDGVRAYWTGKEFLSRLGNPLHAPDWFCAGLPNEPLDGEFWIERKKFQRTVGIVRRQDKSDHWKEIRFLMFDAPAAPARFEDRVKAIEQIVKKNQPPYALAHAHELCKDLDHLRRELARVEALGGEGLMLRQPESKYVVGRSSTLLKIKSFHDAEATVLGHEPGAGRHKGRLGALLVQLPDGTKFSVGTGFSDAEREYPPTIGTAITFRYQELTDAGVPRFPSYVGIRAGAAATVAMNQETPKPVQTAPAKPVPAAPEPKASSSGKRYFEFVEGKSSKFWEIETAGTDVTVRYGRIGAGGQTKTKSFADDAAAQRYAEELIEEKTDKGYVAK